jgi:deoxyribose-phosphate aldolase
VVSALAQNKPVFVPGKGSEPWAAKAREVGIKVGGWELLMAAQGPADGGDCNSCPSVGHCASRCSDKVAAHVAAGMHRIGSPAGQSGVPLNLAPYIDHTLLKADAAEAEFLKLCAEARQFKFASVCVNPGWVKLCAGQLQGSGVMVCTVVGFPLGATSTAAKVAETRKAIDDGADRIDMVLNIGALRSRDLARVEQDIRAVKQACGRRALKVIHQAALLSDEEKVIACELSQNRHRLRQDLDRLRAGRGDGDRHRPDAHHRRRWASRPRGVRGHGRQAMSRRGGPTGSEPAPAWQSPRDQPARAITSERGRRNGKKFSCARASSSTACSRSLPLTRPLSRTAICRSPGETSLYIEIAPGMRNQPGHRHRPEEATRVTPAEQIVERQYGMLELHSDDQGDVRQAGQAILDALGVQENSRLKPRSFPSRSSAAWIPTRRC